MTPKTRPPLADRVAVAARAALAAQDHVGAVDVLLGIGGLDFGAVQRWQQGRLDFLESAIQVKPAPLAEALGLLQSWAAAQGLIARETPQLARTPQRQTRRFGSSGNPAIEQLYRTHWVSPALPEKQRARLVEKVGRAPDLVVVMPLNDAWTCHRCGGSGDFLLMEDPGPACLGCVGLGDLAFLPAGDPLLTRRVKAKSARSAVVVRFSRSRRRYERQGLLAEPAAIAEVQRALDERQRG